MSRIGWMVLLCAATLAGACGRRSAPEAEHGEHEEEGAHEEGVVELTPEQLVTAKLELARVERRAVAGLIEATAQIEPDAGRQARVGTRVSGRVSAFKKNIGDTVKAGDVLAIFESPELGRGKADYLAALAATKVARETAERERKLFEQKISSEKDWREAEAAAIKAQAEKEAAENRLHALGLDEKALPRQVSHYSSSLAVTSPIDGAVVDRPVTLGQMVEPADTLFVVMDLREVWIVFDLYERDLSQVKVGQNVRIKVAAYPDREFPGKVQHIGAVVEPRSRTIKVRLVMDNPEGLLKPGMFATAIVEATSGDRHERLVVPDGAVQRDGDGAMVFVARGEREFERRDVKLADRRGEWATVESGVREGERVVVNGSFLLKSALQKGALGGGHSH
jgi:cobalt-zinc-cadmium efflux system membrane fusion protein